MDSPERNIYDLRFAVDKSLRYHQERRSFFDFLHRSTMFGLIILGSTAFSNVLGDVITVSWLGLVIAALAAFDLVCAWGHKARDHEVLHRRFSDLAKQITELDKISAEKCKKLESERLSIEVSEPPVYRALDAQCDNETRIAHGTRVGMVKMTWSQRRLRNIWRYSGAEFSPISSLPDANVNAESPAPSA